MVAVRVPDEVWGDAEGEALLDHWLVSKGASVQAGQPLAEAVIIKTNVEVVAPVAGVVSQILVPDQGKFARGQDLAHIDE
jgi:pyruvate/2-oxoglutarate dehydrogenase complex dihydrolipoamide acyltransferase (E2) component